jgi:hypothetical protein
MKAKYIRGIYSLNDPRLVEELVRLKFGTVVNLYEATEEGASKGFDRYKLVIIYKYYTILGKWMCKWLSETYIGLVAKTLYLKDKIGA